MRCVVVGAGAWGLPAATELARRGHAVTLVDRYGVGNLLSSSSGPTRLWRLTHPDAVRVRLAQRSVEAMDRLVRFTFRHFLANPWFPRLLAVENLQNARFLKQIRDIPELHSPLVSEIREILARGNKAGVFRADVDPMQLYISIAALGFFYLSNRHTLAKIFGRALDAPASLDERGRHIVDVVLGYLRP